jgi:hypothetical protein
MRVAVFSVVLLAAGLARAQSGLPCPTWEPCGDGGSRCEFRGNELRVSDPACAHELFTMACEEGASGACFELGRDQWNEGARGAGLWRMASGLLGDVAHNPWKFYRGSLLFALLALTLLEAGFLRLARRERPLRTAAWLQLASAPPMLFFFGELELLELLAPMIAFVLVWPIRWRVLKRVAQPPFKRPLIVAFAGLALSWIALAALGVVVVFFIGPPVPGFFSVVAAELGDVGPALLLGLGCTFAAFLIPKTIVIRLFGWSGFGGAFKNALIASGLALVPVSVAAFLLGEWVALSRGHSVAGVYMFGAALLGSIGFEWRVLRRRNPGRRAFLCALAANFASFALLVGFFIFLQQRRY